jgi:hypothetical protein
MLWDFMLVKLRILKDYSENDRIDVAFLQGLPA